MKKFVLFLLITLFMLAGCTFPTEKPTPTIDLDGTLRARVATAFANTTATVEAIVPRPSQTLSPTPTLTITSTAVPIPAPVDAVASNNVTVRSEPRKGGKNLGGIFFNQPMKVIARNDAASWYYIEWPKSPTGMAWVLAAAVDLKKNDPTHLPIAILDSEKKVIVLPPILWEISGAPLPLNTPGPGAQLANLKQLAKVRVGPGLGYSVMSTLNVGASVVITGRTDKNTWVQIEYPSGPDGRGWLAGELIDMKGAFAGLPFYNLLATPISDPEQAGNPPTANPDTTSQESATPEPTPAGPTGQITASVVNVRSGPASKFDLLGTVKLGDEIVITGLTANQLWYQIIYPSAPNGYGYISVKYVKITGGDMTKLRYLNDQGTPLP